MPWSQWERRESGMERIKSGKMINVVRSVVLVMSVLLIGTGVMNQEHTEVLQKAVKICLECIGIG